MKVYFNELTKEFGVSDFYGAIGGGIAGAGLGVISGRSLMRRNANRAGIERGTEEYRKMMNRGAFRGGLIGAGVGAISGGVISHPINKNFKRVKQDASMRGMKDGMSSASDKADVNARLKANEGFDDELKNRIGKIKEERDAYWSNQERINQEAHDKRIGGIKKDIDGVLDKVKAEKKEILSPIWRGGYLSKNDREEKNRRYNDLSWIVDRNNMK